MIRQFPASGIHSSDYGLIDRWPMTEPGFGAAAAAYATHAAASETVFPSARLPLDSGRRELTMPECLRQRFNRFSLQPIKICRKQTYTVYRR